MPFPARSSVSIPALPILGMLLFVLTACASSGAPGQSRSSSMITQEEVEDQAHSQTAFEVIQRLRPNWLQPRANPSLTVAGAEFPVVFVNGRRYGDFQSLHGIPSNDIGSARFLAARDATTLHGTGYPSGIIDITTRRR